MRILVTGGNGLLGGYLLRELIQSGHSVTSYARHPSPTEGANSVIGDVNDPTRLRQAVPGHEVVVHLAGVTGPGRALPEQLMETNLMGTVRVLEAALEAGAGKIVFASSCAASGFAFQPHEITPSYLPLDENHPAEPQDEYGLSKLLGEITCKRYSAAFGIRTICLRINNAWYVDREGAAIAGRSGWAKGLTVEEIWTRRYLKFLLEPDGEWPIPGPPAPRKLLWGFTDARDVAQAFRLAIENKELVHEVFAINGADTCSLIPTRELLAHHFPQVPVRAALEGFATLVSNDKATRLLGYKPQYTWRSSDFRDWLEPIMRSRGLESLQ
jgi:UDP-glucose 4-epimerase